LLGVPTAATPLPHCAGQGDYGGRRQG
jgi:hypothetical protein